MHDEQRLTTTGEKRERLDESYVVWTTPRTKLQSSDQVPKSKALALPHKLCKSEKASLYHTVFIPLRGWSKTAPPFQNCTSVLAGSKVQDGENPATSIPGMASYAQCPPLECMLLLIQ
jgi:hypothetical protein